MFSLPLRRFLGGEWLGHMVSACLTLWEPFCILTSNVQRVPLVLHFYQYLLLSFSLTWAMPVGVQEFKIWVYLMANDFEQVFICILAVYIFSFEVSIQNFCPLKKMSCLLIIDYKSYLAILDTSPLSDAFCKNFPVCGFPLHFLHYDVDFYKIKK